MHAPDALAELTPADIQNLIDSEVAENLTLEYKQTLPTGGTDQKREFIYDVAALANQAGGDIVYGVVDRRGQDNQSTGVAERLTGMTISNVQTEIARLSNLIRDSIAPRLAGVVMQHVSCPQGDVLVIRVPQSWNRPHMVTFDGVNRFFGRSSTGRYLMSVEQIGRAFSEQRELSETIERWRKHRAELASKNAGPIALASEVTMLFHVMPASAFNRELLRTSWKLSREDILRIHVPHGTTNSRYNADGCLVTAQLQPKSVAFGYTQIFRSGIIEYADSQCYFPHSGSQHSMILGQELEKQMVNCYQDAITRFRKQGQSGGLYVGFSLIGIKDKNFDSAMIRRRSSNPSYGIRQDVFVSPEVYVDINEPEESPYRSTLLPLVDTMWQVAGMEGTPFKRGDLWEPFIDYY
jgi:hypothetical protein